MSELEFPTIDPVAAEAASTAIAKASGTEVATDITKVDLGTLIDACFTKAHADVEKANKTLKDLVLDLPNQAKVDDAIAMRNRLIKTPVAEIRKITKAVKSSLDQGSKRAGANLDALVAKFDAADTLTAQIDAAQTRIDEEKEAARLKEEARIQKHRDALAKLAEPAERCRQADMTAERIAKGIALVSAIAIDREAWEEFADKAEAQKAVTLERMQALHAAAVAAEAEAARLAAEKAEQERKAAELKAEADRLAAERAEFERQKAELQAEKDRVAAEAKAKADEAARVLLEQQEAVARAEQAERDAEAQRQADALANSRVESEQSVKDAILQREAQTAETNTTEQGSQQVLKAEASTPDATDRDAPASTSPSVGSMGAGQAADAAPVAGAKPVITIELEEAVPFVPEQVEVPTLSLGEIKTRIKPIQITAEGLAELGFAATKVKASCMYLESDYEAMKAAMRKVLA